MTENDIVMTFLNVQAQLKILHWQTNNYAAHKAFDMAYNELNPLIDKYIEVYQGLINDRFVLTNGTLEVVDSNVIDLPSFIISFKKFLTSDIEEEISDQSLTHIIDEMLAVINKLQYLLTLE